jgi:hypothetical protein
VGDACEPEPMGGMGGAGGQMEEEPPPPDFEGGCDCRNAGVNRSSSRGQLGWALALLGLCVPFLRRRRARRRSSTSQRSRRR